MALLRLLPVRMEDECIDLLLDLEIDFKAVGMGQAETQFFCLFTDKIIVHRETCIENDLIQPMESGAAEAEFLTFRGQWCGG